MNFHVPVKLLKVAIKQWPKEFTKDIVDMSELWGGERELTLSATRLPRSRLADFQKLAKINGANGLANKIGLYMNLIDNVAGKRITRLEELNTALKLYLKSAPNFWVFGEQDDGYPVPFFVSHIKKVDRYKDTPPYVRMTLQFMDAGKPDERYVDWETKDLGKNLVELLNEAGYYRATKSAIEQYQKDIEIFKKLSPMVGQQFTATGFGFFAEEGYDNRFECSSLECDGQPARLVLDDLSEEKDDDSSSRRWRGKSVCDEGLGLLSFWEKDEDPDDVDEQDEAAKTCALPVHPYLKCFDLVRHEFVWVHCSNMVQYVYDSELVDKLVLPSDTKSLVKILMHGASIKMDDIIKGKTGGVIVIASGPPGTGKTLTAEVFSEHIKCPLYVVQCSQLGIDEETVEGRLRTVLARSQRWGALLLIDEADVYVHERGHDIHQNAIVGVFLRVLEYYRGILFMTSNRATIIDDAIMSRATAWLKYDFPTPDELKSLWQILGKQYGVALSDRDIDLLIRDFPILSGRNIKNMLKLSRMLAAEKKAKVTTDTIRYCAKFLDLSHGERADGKSNNGAVASGRNRVPAKRKAGGDDGPDFSELDGQR